MSVHDAREIRALAQQRGIDIFGGNSLGVADSWNQVRIGGALGGDAPQDTLRKGSVAILSNSGGFTTTIAQYLRMAGWGTTTWCPAARTSTSTTPHPNSPTRCGNDERSQAAVLYCEPGGYYELDAEYTKPVVACVVGRWKSQADARRRSCRRDVRRRRRRGLQGTLVHGEVRRRRALHDRTTRWCSAKGAVVTNIAHIPAALTAVMALRGVKPDFAPEGTMELKPWFGSNGGVTLPREIDLPVVGALAPYGQQIKALESQVGASFPREALKDASGVSQMDAKTQVTRVNGVSVLEAAQYSIEGNVGLVAAQGARRRERPQARQRGDRRLAQPARRRHARRRPGRARGRQRAERRAGRGGGHRRTASARTRPCVGGLDDRPVQCRRRARRARCGPRCHQTAAARCRRAPTAARRTGRRARAGHARRPEGTRCEVGVRALARAAGRPPEWPTRCWPRSPPPWAGARWCASVCRA